MPEKVLIVEDELHARTGLTELVASWGYSTEGAADGAEAMTRILAWWPAIIVTDLKMPRVDGMELLRRIGELPGKFYVVMLTAQGSIESAVNAMRIGAWDYLPKPLDPVKLKGILQSASRQREADATTAEPIKTIRKSNSLGDIVGSSLEMKAVFSLIERVASSNVSVLVTGESGTGKELVARALHSLSSRRGKPFVAVNCAAIPETHIEREIFGYESSAFTGTTDPNAGCFELAEQGTLLLDEIGDMPPPTQAKLLRVLEDRRLRRIGSNQEMQVDVRVVAATNRDLQQAVANGVMRSDLYYRLNVVNIHMPPLRAHLGDVRMIAEQMILDMNEKHHCSVSGMSEAFVGRLISHRWPGNVRELRNAIERAVVLAGKGILGIDSLPVDFGEKKPSLALGGITPVQNVSNESAVHVEVGTTVNEAERRLILKTLTSTDNNKTRAAEILGISTKTLQNKLKEYRTSSNPEK